MKVREECRYCDAHLFGDLSWPLSKQAFGPCETCAAKLSRLLAAMPDPATTCGAISKGGQGWCLKQIGHDVEDEEGKADPYHVMGVVSSPGEVSWVSRPPIPTPASLPVISTSKPDPEKECWCLQLGRRDPDCPIPAHQAKAALEREKELIRARKEEESACSCFEPNVWDPSCPIPEHAAAAERELEKRKISGYADPYRRFKFTVEVPATTAPGDLSDLERWRQQVFAEHVESPPVDVEIEIDGKAYLLKGLRPLGPPAPILLEGDEGVGEEATQDYSFESKELIDRVTVSGGYGPDGHLEQRVDFAPFDMGKRIASWIAQLIEVESALLDLDRDEDNLDRIDAAFQACRILVDGECPVGSPGSFPDLTIAHGHASRALGDGLTSQAAVQITRREAAFEACERLLANRNSGEFTAAMDAASRALGHS